MSDRMDWVLLLKKLSITFWLMKDLFYRRVHSLLSKSNTHMCTRRHTHSDFYSLTLLYRSHAVELPLLSHIKLRHSSSLLFAIICNLYEKKKRHLFWQGPSTTSFSFSTLTHIYMSDMQSVCKSNQFDMQYYYFYHYFSLVRKLFLTSDLTDWTLCMQCTPWLDYIELLLTLVCRRRQTQRFEPFPSTCLK